MMDYLQKVKTKPHKDLWVGDPTVPVQWEGNSMTVDF